MGADPAVRVSVPEGWAEIAGAVLLDLLGPFQEFDEGGLHHMIFYPFRHGVGFVEDERILAELPDDPVLREAAEIERVLVPTGWEEGWKDHFKPITVGRLYIRPPWEQPPPSPARDVGAGPGTGSAAGPAPTGGSRAPAGTGAGSTEAPALLDIVLTPGLAFGTGLHPTTRGVLDLLQDEASSGPVVDVGTGSGILAISAGKLGFGPIIAFDNDPLAVTAARSNAQENGVDVRAEHTDLGEAPSAWFDDATILANLTLEPVLALISQLARRGALFRRLLVSGILSGEQEAAVVAAAARSGLSVGRRLYETEWVSMDLRLRA
ncbi:MAG: 50S ribosomal protein L11 methyltransferase [Thermoleophilia bacterium]